MRKDRRIPAREELPRIFDKTFILRLAQLAKLSWAANITRFSEEILRAARQYIADMAVPSATAVRDEIKALYSAADRYRYKETATRIIKLSERTRALMNTRADRLGLTIPEPEVLRDHACQDEACKAIVLLLRVGVKGGKPLLYTPEQPDWEPQRRTPRRKAELDFIMWLGVAYLQATGMPPTHMANPDRPGPFARMVQACLDKIAPGANAGALLNKLNKRRLAKAPDLRKRKSGTGPKTRT